MCQDCGCSDVQSVVIDGKKVDVGHQHEHHHHHESDSSHNHEHATNEIVIEKDILHKNNHIAQHNRQLFIANQIIAVNWISAPGSGKTALLERIISDLQADVSIAVIEGDQQTSNDAERIRRTGAEAIQINTGAACHLNAEMIHQAVEKLNLDNTKLLMIENVGNMVCPTAYDLGEMLKIAVISCPEGDDKPEKYPDLLLVSNVLLINKIDLLPYLDFDLDKCVASARKINPNIAVFTTSAKTGQGLGAFYEWLTKTFSIKSESK